MRLGQSAIKPCECWRPTYALDEESAGISDMHHTFDAFEPRTDRLSEALSAVKQFARQPETTILLLLGRAYSGKTHLLVSAARTALQAGIPARYTTMSGYFELSQLAANFDAPATARARLSDMRACDLLLLDGLSAGSEAMTRRMDDLIIERCDRQRAMIIATQYDPRLCPPEELDGYMTRLVDSGACRILELDA